MGSRPRVILLGLLAVFVLAIGRVSSISAAIDLSGDWTYTMSGDYSGTCAVQLTQVGEDITGAFDCPGFEDDGTLVGVLTQVDGTTHLEGEVTVDYQGETDVWAVSTTVYPAGNTITGEWEAEEGYGGTMVGVRNVPIYIKGDLNCDGEITGPDVLSGMLWSLDLDPLQQPDCPEIESDLGVIFGDIDCDDASTEIDGMTLLHHLAGFAVILEPDCLDIGDTYSPVIPT